LLNWAGSPLIAEIEEPGDATPKQYDMPKQGAGAKSGRIHARAGSVLRLFKATPTKSFMYERMVVPHDGSMGTTSIFPCGTVHSKEVEALQVNMTCDESVPTRLWNCVRLAAPPEEWPREKYGFTPSEVKLTLSEERKYEAYATEARTPWTAPAFTDGPGFVILKMPPDVHAAAQFVYRNGRSQVEGDVPGHYSNFYGQRKEGNAWTFVSLDDFQKQRAVISEGVQRVLTWWTGKPLQHEATYGIRVYHRNAVLLTHRDVPTTHFISAVLQINQTAEEGWPLHIETQRKPMRYAEVYLQPGYMALYEGVRLQHGRPMRFNGSEFAMAFTHNRLIDYFPQNGYVEPSEEASAHEL